MAPYEGRWPGGALKGSFGLSCGGGASLAFGGGAPGRTPGGGALFVLAFATVTCGVLGATASLAIRLVVADDNG